jgi:hypothetical protein
VEALGIVLASLGIALALGAIALTVAVERLKRPRLEIKAGDWPHPAPWKFAVVHVINHPEMPWPFGFLTRSSAEGCRVTLEFREHASPEVAFSLPGRWSSRPEPGTPVAVPQQALGRGALSASVGVSGTATPELLPEVVRIFDPALATESQSLDVAASPDYEEVAVAVLAQSGAAYAWGAESQRFPQWDNPAWKLNQPGQYDVTVKLRASGVTAERTFLLTLGPPETHTIEIRDHPVAESASAAPRAD